MLFPHNRDSADAALPCGHYPKNDYFDGTRCASCGEPAPIDRAGGFPVHGSSSGDAYCYRCAYERRVKTLGF